MTDKFDITIIGAGPTGLFAAYYGGFRGLRIKLIDSIVRYPGKVKLIATGFGEATTAVNNAAAYINPKLKVFPGHSSTLMDKEGVRPEI